jgi:hypothetical protein
VSGADWRGRRDLGHLPIRRTVVPAGGEVPAGYTVVYSVVFTVQQARGPQPFCARRGPETMVSSRSRIIQPATTTVAARPLEKLGSLHRPEKQAAPACVSAGQSRFSSVPQEGIEPPTGGLEGRCSIP